MAFNIFLLFTVSYFLHFTSRFPGLAIIRFDLLLYIILALIALLSGEQGAEKKDEDRIAKALFLFFACAMLSVPLAMWPGSVLRFGLENFLKSVIFFFFIVKFIKTEKQLKIFIFVFLFCQVYRGLEPAYLHFTQGYWGSTTTSHVGGQMSILDRLSGAPHDIVNPNQLAWVIINTIPFLYYLGYKARHLYLRLGAIALFGILLYPLMLTGSRTGLVALLATILGIAFLGENRWRRVFIICLVVIPLGMLVTSLLSPDMSERYLSLVDQSAIGADSAAGRVTGLKNNISTAMNLHGIFGHGLGTSTEVNVHYLGSEQPAHDLYIETLQEVGVVGLILFFRYIAITLSALKQAKSRLLKMQENFQARMVMALQVWVFMDLVYSLACFGLSSWEWYLFGGLASVSARFAVNESRSKAEGDGLGERSGNE